MKTIVSSLLAAFGLTMAAPLQAQVPQYIAYQGRITASDVNVAGPTGQFMFAIVSQGGGTTFWEPGTPLTLRITDGLFTVVLGADIPADGEVPAQSMPGISPSVFSNPNVKLRIWFRKDSSEPTFTQLSPDQKIGAAGYAMMAYSVIPGAIGPNKLATDAVSEEKLQDGAVSTDKIMDGAVTREKLAPGAITSAALSPSLDLGAAGVCGLLDLFSTDIETPGLTLNGCQSEISAFAQNNGVEGVELKAFDFGGLLSLRDPNERLNLQAGSAVNGGGFASWYNDQHFRTVLVDGSDINKAGFVGVANSAGFDRVLLLGQGENAGGEVVVNSEVGRNSILLQGKGSESESGEIVLKSATGRTAIQMIGAENAQQTGAIFLFQSNGVPTVEIDGELGSNGGSQISLANGRGTNTITIDSQENTGSGGLVYFYDGNGRRTVAIKGDTGGRAGWMALYRDGRSAPAIELDASDEDGGFGRVTTQVLEITGGSDLSENFDIKAIHDELKAGMIVCIDPANPGHLLTSSKAYDHTVAGIVSGAGGVQPGMLMGQHGTAADGKHPVALSGRVYCWVDADQGAIAPGDLLTTSDTPGHGMKASEPARAQGAIIGKAMTGLTSGRGLVLVLVSLQ